MGKQHQQQELAVNSGHWPLFRFDPRRAAEGMNPMVIDSKEPSVPFLDLVKSEPRFRGLMKHVKDEGEGVMDEYQSEIEKRFRLNQHMADEGFSPNDPNAVKASEKS